MNKDILPVLDEISAVLKKHDMTGLMIVGNKSHCDWRMNVEASWSCARTEMDAQGLIGLRIRSRRAEYPSLEAQKETVERTVGTFVTFGHALAKLNEQIDTLLVAVSKQVDFLGKSTDEN